MLKTVILGENALEPDTWERHDVDSVYDFLDGYLCASHTNTRIYHKNIAQECDVTPKNEADARYLDGLDGPFYVITYPGDPLTIIVAIVAIVAIAAVAFLIKPPVPDLKNTRQQSPNNALNDRRNSPRPNGRIPDIYGTVRSTPDLLSSYKVFENHQEVEYSYLCIGRGAYAVSSTSIKDDTTLISDIAGSTVEIYAPDTSPNSGDSPQLRVGDAISEGLYIAKRNNSVNGQVLRAPNSDRVVGVSDIRFEYPNVISLDPASEIDFEDHFAGGDSLTIANAAYSGATAAVSESVSIRCTAAGAVEFQSASTAEYFVGSDLTITSATFTYSTASIDLSGTYTIASKSAGALVLSSPASINSDWNNIAGVWPGDVTEYKTCPLATSSETLAVDLSGTYTVLSVSALTITLSSPSSTNSDWAELTYYVSDRTGYISPTLSTSGNKWIGPFTLDDTSLTNVYSNFVGTNGLYKDDGENQIAVNVTVELELTPVDASGTPTGSAETFQTTIDGSATVRTTRAATIKANPTFTGRCKVRARRVSNTDTAFGGTVVDEVKWRDVYSMTEVADNDFGDVTTVHSVTYATDGALALKERKLNMEVTRKLPQRVSGSTFTSTLYATNSADDIISAICLDPYIGNRSASEVDFDSIYDTVAEIETYFGHANAKEFCYTFDNENLSFEETVATIAQSIFCVAYRQGNQIKLSFEKETSDSVLLFNHRNKLPGTEKRTVRFGNQDDNDGIEYEWIDPVDDTQVTLYIPSDKSATNPKNIKSVGVRNGLQARLQAYRAWNKIRYQNVAVEFEATQEADLLVINDRVLVADNTRSGTQDGEVVSVSGLILTLSQDVIFEMGQTYTIFLQHTNGTVESIGCTLGNADNQVVLSTAPTYTLYTDEQGFAKATYMIVGSASTREQAFLVAEKDTNDNFTLRLSAVNYSDLYYNNDQDYNNSIVDENGIEL